MSNITFKVLKEAMLARGWGYKSDAPPLHPSALTWAHVFIKGNADFYGDDCNFLRCSTDWHSYTLQEVYDIITKEDVPKQVVLKVGDYLYGIYESICCKNITGFNDQGNPVYSHSTVCVFKNSTCDWYVNGVLYKRADILLPTEVVNNAAAPIKSAPMHDSDCSQHNEPAYPNEPCDCSVSGKVVLRLSDVVQTTENPATDYGRNISGFTVGGFHRKCDAPNSPIFLSDWNYLWINGVKRATKDIALPKTVTLKIGDIVNNVGDMQKDAYKIVRFTTNGFINQAGYEWWMFDSASDNTYAVNGVTYPRKNIIIPTNAAEPMDLPKQDVLGSGDYFVPPAQELVIHIPDNVGRVKLVTNLSNLIVEVDNIGVQQ